MEKIIEFCKENNYDFITETLSNGVFRAVIEDVNLHDVEGIKEKAIKSGLCADATAYGNERDVFIYNKKGWEEMMKRFKPNPNINTIDDMIDVLTKAKNLLGGDAPFFVDNDCGTLNLTINNNVLISKGALIINASDWSVPAKDMDL